MEAKTISWIGLGHMGVPMSLNLLKAGYKLSVYNRTIDKAKPLANAGATICTSIAEAANADIIFIMLSDDAATRAVFDELFSTHSTGNQLIINMSTISVALTEELAARAKDKGVRYLEAPVSGSVKPATDGTLIILAGGKEKNFTEAKPLFEKLGKLSLYLGEAGQGAKAKIAINYYMSVVIEGLAETVLFAEKNGIDRETMMQIVNQSACGSPMSNMKTASILKNEYPAAFPLKHMHKDIGLAQKLGLKTTMSDAIGKAYNEAMNDNLGDEDLMAVIKTLKEKYF